MDRHRVTESAGSQENPDGEYAHTMRRAYLRNITCLALRISYRLTPMPTL